MDNVHARDIDLESNEDGQLHEPWVFLTMLDQMSTSEINIGFIYSVIELLARRPAMPSGVRLVSWEPKAAPVRLSECSTVTDVNLFILSTLRQLAAHLNGEGWQDGGWGLSGLLERLAACGCVVALDDPRKAIQ